MNQQTVKRNLQHPDKWIGKHVNPNKWAIPEGYALCEKTGKFYPYSQLGITFAHYVFDKQWLLARNIYIEDAAWLSEEGYDEIIEVIKREGKYTEYVERF